MDKFSKGEFNLIEVDSSISIITDLSFEKEMDVINGITHSMCIDGEVSFLTKGDGAITPANKTCLIEVMFDDMYIEFEESVITSITQIPYAGSYKIFHAEWISKNMTINDR